MVLRYSGPVMDRGISIESSIGVTNPGLSSTKVLRDRYHPTSDARISILDGLCQNPYESATLKLGNGSQIKTEENSYTEPDCPKHLKPSSKIPSSKLPLDHACPQLPPIEQTIELLSEAHIASHIIVADTDASEKVTFDEDYGVLPRVIPKWTGSSQDKELFVESNLSTKSLVHNSKPIDLTHLPPAFLARRGYLPSIDTSYLQSPAEMDLQDEIILEPTRRNELKELWSCTNGWQTSLYEGRRFCLKITTVCADVPIYVFSSSTQAFYSIKYTTTSTSSQMSTMRYDPEKNASISILGFSKFDKGVEVISATLEKNGHQIPLDDGLIALICPKVANGKFIQLATKFSKLDTSEHAVAALNKECGRLVWDENSGSYFLVHPAMRTPFLVTIRTTPDSSTIKYMLEHEELPTDLVTLVRDGAGDGFLEIDTSCATRVTSTYIIDVAVSAIMLVAILTEEKILEIDKMNMVRALELSGETQLSPLKDQSFSEGPRDDNFPSQKELYPETLRSDLESQNTSRVKEADETKRTPAIITWDRILTQILKILGLFLKIFHSKDKLHQTK